MNSRGDWRAYDPPVPTPRRPVGGDPPVPPPRPQSAHERPTERNDAAGTGWVRSDEWRPETHDDRRPSWDSGHGGSRPRRPRPAIDWSDAFARLGLTHALSVGGDAIVAIALANSLFFSIDPSESKPKILAYLIFTMAPFALVGPLLGPMMDRIRGGHRLVIIASLAGRALLAFAMVSQASGGLLLFPEAFLTLVLGKTYAVAKSSMVPSTVNSDAELVEANSKLQLLSGIAGFALGVPAGVLSLIGSPAVLIFGGLVFVVGMVSATRIAPVADSLGQEHAPDPDSVEADASVTRVTINAMSWLRAVVGLVTFLLAFALRSPPPTLPLGGSLGRAVGNSQPSVRSGAPLETAASYPRWYFGVVVAVSVLGGLVGSMVAPRLRAVAKEERILFGCLLGAVAAGLSGVLFQGLMGMTLLAFLVAVSAGIGKQAFDALVQAEVPDANRGRLFSRFEARFQIVWVLGALIPVLLPLSVPVGAVLVLIGSVAATVSFRRGWRRGGGLPKPPPRGGAARKRDELVSGVQSAFANLWRLGGTQSSKSR